MSVTKIRKYLLEEETVSVVFIKDCSDIGFIVNLEMANTQIPKNYMTILPFWLASQLAELGIVQIKKPEWIQNLGPGANIDSTRPYLFANEVKKVSVLNDEETESPISQLCKERVETVINASMMFNTRQYDNTNQIVFLQEENGLIQKMHKNIQDVQNWK
jgi:hypothetical protein